EDNFLHLERQLAECFSHKKGPGDLPVSKRSSRMIKGAIVPHAGYFFSGPCAAWVHKEIAESAFPDTFLIIGTNHTGFPSHATMKMNWETPFGIVRTDDELIRLLVEKAGMVNDEHAFENEHSIEVQLPFLQFANKDLLGKLRIAPLILGHRVLYDVKALALTLQECIMDLGRRVCILVSSDFTHYGPNYHFVPFEGEPAERLYAFDQKAIDFIRKKDRRGFENYIDETNATICGAQPIALLMEILKNAEKIQLLQYYTSGDIIQDYKNAVGYAAITFE
ncbi:AmmeMemoRadiSam system protein B, partial [Candidatus Woesearchaeota archaeon CG_4_10_14_0_8_um_filter_47_5]